MCILAMMNIPSWRWLRRRDWSARRYDRCFCQAEGGIRDLTVTGVQTCALPISITCRTFLAIGASSSSLGRDDERVVRYFRELHKVGGAATTEPRDRLGRSALVHAEAALHPVHCPTLALCFSDNRLHPILGVGVILLSQVAAGHRIRVRSLFREGDVDRALVREDVQVVPAASGDA